MSVGGRLFAFMRSNAKLEAIKLRHGVANIGKPAPDPTLVQRAEDERAEIARAINDVFYGNVHRYGQQLDTDLLLGALEGIYQYADIRDMFLFGIVSEVTENSPPLPTQPADRVGIHLLAHFMHTTDATLDEAREQLSRIMALQNDADPMLDWVVSMGRQAYQTSDDRLLAECHRKACL